MQQLLAVARPVQLKALPTKILRIIFIFKTLNLYRQTGSGRKLISRGPVVTKQTFSLLGPQFYINKLQLWVQPIKQNSTAGLNEFTWKHRSGYKTEPQWRHHVWLHDYNTAIKVFRFPKSLNLKKCIHMFPCVHPGCVHLCVWRTAHVL